LTAANVTPVARQHRTDSRSDWQSKQPLRYPTNQNKATRSETDEQIIGSWLGCCHCEATPVGYSFGQGRPLLVGYLDIRVTAKPERMQATAVMRCLFGDS
jgi:hypothetical protein